MDLRKIKKLMELLEESGIAEIEVKEGEESIKLSRNITSSAAPLQQMVQHIVKILMVLFLILLLITMTNVNLLKR